MDTALRGATRGIDSGEVHLWALHSTEAADEQHPLPTDALDGNEREKASSFVRAADRLQYVMAHIALRRVLAMYLGIEPAEVGFGRAPCFRCGGPHGRPVLLDARLPLHFSLSHSHGRVLIAVARTPVGVDVQRIPSAEVTDLCLPTMQLRERQEISGRTAAERPSAFAELWTRKEAYLKGLGAGLGHGLAADYLGSDLLARPAGWIIANAPGGPGYAAAVALMADTGHLATLRMLPSRCLAADDAAELTTARPTWRSLLPVWAHSWSQQVST